MVEPSYAIVLAVFKTQTLNALVGALTCYLVASGWVADRLGAAVHDFLAVADTGDQAGQDDLGQRPHAVVEMVPPDAPSVVLDSLETMHASSQH
jgi:hypothetical protein